MNTRALTTDVLLGMLPIALAIAVWQAISSFGYAPVTLLPPPGLVFQRLAQQLVTGSFQHAVAATLLRLFAGFSIAVIVGVAIGLAAASSPAINAVVRPIVRVLAPLPKVALYPAMLLLVGFGHAKRGPSSRAGSPDGGEASDQQSARTVRALAESEDRTARRFCSALYVPHRECCPNIGYGN